MNIGIYTRKSVYSDKSDSILSQYTMGVEYIKSHYTYYDNIFRYEDEGYTGANTNRPGFNQLVENIKNKEINVLICYKIDRISRDVKDFSSFYSFLSEHNVEFVSIKEQIDTSTPLGRAMMYICSVFAQMERETIAERVKDNMIELSKAGKWTGGKAPLGYKRKKVQIGEKTHTILEKNPDELPYLNEIFDTFLEGYTLTRLETYFRRQGIKSINGAYLSGSQLYFILKNPHYVAADEKTYDYFKNLGCTMSCDKKEFNGKNGIVVYGRTIGGKNKKHMTNPPQKWIVSVGLHEPIMTSDKWLAVQKRFGLNEIDKNRKYEIGILKGILKCKCGYTMGVKHKVDKTYQKIYDDYFCQQRSRKGKEYCDCKFVHVNILDDAVLDVLKNIKLNKSIINKYVPQDDNKVSIYQKKELEKKIKNIELKIFNLTAAIADNSSSSATKFLVEEIERLDKQLANLQSELKEISSLFCKKEQIEKNKESKYMEVCKIVDNLDKLSYKELNDLLKKLLTECIYDGEKLYIKFC